jgi:hypothetical protein
MPVYVNLCSQHSSGTVSCAVVKTSFIYLTLCRSYLKPYCMGRKTVLFSAGHLIYTIKQERFTAFRPAGGVRDGKGLIYRLAQYN